MVGQKETAGYIWGETGNYVATKGEKMGSQMDGCQFTVERKTGWKKKKNFF